MNMRRRAYPYGRYLIKDKKVADLGLKLKDFIEKLDFPIVKYDENNEGVGTLIIGVNKKIIDLIKQKKPSGHLQEIFYELFSLFSVDVVSLRDMDEESQRIGLEIYLWPTNRGVLMEMFVLPYMEHLNKTEIFSITETAEEEITDWYLCEQTWEHIEPKIVSNFNAEPVHMRG